MHLSWSKSLDRRLSITHARRPQTASLAEARPENALSSRALPSADGENFAGVEAEKENDSARKNYGRVQISTSTSTYLLPSKDKRAGQKHRKTPEQIRTKMYFSTRDTPILVRPVCALMSPLIIRRGARSKLSNSENVARATDARATDARATGARATV